MAILPIFPREKQPGGRAPRPGKKHVQPRRRLLRRATSVDFDDDSNEWLNPPQDSTGEPIWVDMRVNIDRLSHIDTVQSCLTIKVALVMYWNDERLIGWDNAASDVVGAVARADQRAERDDGAGRIRRDGP